LAIGSSLALTSRFDFQRGSIGKRQQLLNGNGLRGTLEEDISRIRTNFYRVNGSISFQPNAAELALLLPWILGTAAAGNVYALADVVLTRYVQTDQIVKVFAHAGCAVNRARFHASQGGPLSVDLDIVGQTEGSITTTVYTEGAPGAAGSFPSLTIDTATGPFIFTDLALTVGGVTYNAKEFEVTVDNGIDTERFFNSATLVSTVKTNRQIPFRTSLPYGDASAVYGSGASGVAVNATFTNGAVSCLFGMAAVAFPADAPTVPGREEIMLSVEGNAYHTGSTNSLIVTLDSTP
jgi:hypothetical protein